jgi:hypothetical protein
MAPYIILGLGLWFLGGLLAVGFAQDARERYHARYEAPFLPVCEWELMGLEGFRVAAELSASEMTADAVSAYLKRYEGHMCFDAASEIAEFYIRPELIARGWNRV